MCFRSRIKKLLGNRQGVALFIVLASMATLAIFVGEITYTAQINQKLAYDRLDQIKAQALAKSGLRIALLRIRAYDQLKKTIGDATGGNDAAKAVADAMVPKAILEKIWSEPITIPFSGDVSALPTAARDALIKFRKDSGMEGKLYISIQAQSSRFNLNSTIAAFAPTPAPNKPGGTTTGGDTPAGGDTTGTTAGGTTAGASTTPTATPASYDVNQARTLLTEQLTETFRQKFEDDEKFRDRYRNLQIKDLADEMLGWNDLTFDSLRAQSSNIPFKQAPYYHVSELHYLPSVDDEIYELLAPEYSASVNSQINVNTITEPVLKALVPTMTVEERKKFFDFKAGITESGTPQDSPGAPQDNTFKKADDFLKYLKEKVASFGGSDSKISDFKTALLQRGIELVTDETNFIVRIEATVQQTKRTLEANVSVVPESKKTTPLPNQPIETTPQQRSNLKITQLRFL